MIVLLIKKWILGKLNALLKSYETDVAKCRENVDLWIGRLNRIMGLLERFSERLSDNQISEKEADETFEDVKNVVNEWR